MAFPSCFCHPQLSLKTGLVIAPKPSFHKRMNLRPSLTIESRQGGGTRTELGDAYGFLRGSRSIIQPELRKTILYKKSSRVYSSLLPASQIASTAFTWGTVAVLPFYTLMLVAPRAVLTRRSMDSGMPYIALGLLYAYLLYLSWTPESLQYIFATKYWMPELSGMAKMFSNEMSLASAWIHLLAVDLFAARQVYRDGLQNNIETRHSVSLCLFICPVGVLTHLITKALTGRSRRNKNQIH